MTTPSPDSAQCPCDEPEADGGRRRGRRVHVVGPVCFDLVFSGLPVPPRPGTEVRASYLGISPGGVANVAVALARLGLDVALYSGLTYAYLLIMMFPLYNAIESLDRNQIEAARDLGAPWWHIHLFVVMPYAKPGIASGATLVFMLCAGALAAPLILGGPKTLWFTPIVYDRFFQAFNWPQGAAYALILLSACMAFVLLVMRLFKVRLSEIAR